MRLLSNYFVKIMVFVLTWKNNMKEIPGQQSSWDKAKKYLAVSIFIILVGMIIIPRLIVRDLQSEVDTAELRGNLEKSGQEFDALRDELNRKDLMLALEQQEGKPFEKIPMNVIRDFLNKRGE